MEYAKKHGAEKVVIETNSALKPAVHIYEKYGFKSVPIEKTDFARVDLVVCDCREITRQYFLFGQFEKQVNPGCPPKHGGHRVLVNGLTVAVYNVILFK